MTDINTIHRRHERENYSKHERAKVGDRHRREKKCMQHIGRALKKKKSTEKAFTALNSIDKMIKVFSKL